jgi:hypothetical protein
MKIQRAILFFRKNESANGHRITADDDGVFCPERNPVLPPDTRNTGTGNTAKPVVTIRNVSSPDL